MDSLALLCNLHGDGPTTLRKLREAGCRAIPDLSRLSVRELGSILGRGDRAAQRFLREASLLEQRLDLEWNAADEGPAETDAPLEPPVATPRRNGRHRAPSPGAEPSPPARDADPREPEPREETVLAALVEAWRLGEARREPPAGTAPRRPADLGPGSRDPAPFEPPAPEPAHEEPAPAAAGHPLAGASLGGLDPATLDGLRAAGVRTLEALVAARPVDLVAGAGLRITHVLRLQFQARRALEGFAGDEVRPPGPPA